MATSVIMDPGHEMKARLRASLREAMRAKLGDEARLLRALIAALDNAEAPALTVEQGKAQQHRFEEGSAEIQRLALGAEQVRAVLLAEIEEREKAAAEMDRLARPDHAAALRAEALLARRFLD